MDLATKLIFILNWIMLSVAVHSYVTSSDGVYLPPPGKIVLKTALASSRHVGFGAVVTSRSRKQDQSKFHLRMYGLNNPNFQYGLPPEQQTGGLNQPDRTKPAFDRTAEVFRNIADRDEREHKRPFKSTKEIPRQRGLTSIGVRTQGLEDSYKSEDGELYNVQFRRHEMKMHVKNKRVPASRGSTEKNINIHYKSNIVNDASAAGIKKETSETKPFKSSVAAQPQGVAQSFAPVTTSTVNNHGPITRLNDQSPKITVTHKPPHDTRLSEFAKSNYKDKDHEFKEQTQASNVFMNKQQKHVSSMIFDPPETPNSKVPDKLYHVPVKHSVMGPLGRHYKESQAFGGDVTSQGSQLQRGFKSV